MALIPVPHLVDVIAALYDPPAGYFDVVQTTSGICWAIRYESDAALITCRGSFDPRDWLIDGLSEGSRVIPGYPSIGHVPFGFGMGLLDAYKAIRAALRASTAIYLLGHSLGAARACELAGMFIADGIALAELVLCGCPKPGMIPLVTLLASMGPPIINLRNGVDPVPNDPFPLPPWLEWRDMTPFKMLNAPPDLTKPTILSEIAPEAEWHHIALYQKGALAEFGGS